MHTASSAGSSDSFADLELFCFYVLRFINIGVYYEYNHTKNMLLPADYSSIEANWITLAK